MDEIKGSNLVFKKTTKTYETTVLIDEIPSNIG